MQPHIISKSDIHKIDFSKECVIIKEFFTSNECTEVSEFLKKFKKHNEENFKSDGENWHYTVKSNGNCFQTFIFNELCGISFLPLVNMYQSLFNLYIDLGECNNMNTFAKQIATNDFSTNKRIINPLVFSYPVGLSNFGWHKHDIRAQKFQLLANLSIPEFDYTGGETFVYMAEGKPDKQENSEEKCVIFDKKFDQGDIFSFPYDKWHKVNPTESSKVSNGQRTSMLMPLGARNSEQYKNEFLD